MIDLSAAIPSNFTPASLVRSVAKQILAFRRRIWTYRCYRQVLRETFGLGIPKQNCLRAAKALAKEELCKTPWPDPKSVAKEEVSNWG